MNGKVKKAQEAGAFNVTPRPNAKKRKSWWKLKGHNRSDVPATK